MGRTNHWTDEERAKLRKMREQGLTYDVMAERLGRGNEAISRELRRMGLNDRHRAPAKPKPKSVPRVGKVTLPPL
jgi:IS30 family transposase